MAIDADTVKQAENVVRDARNWLAVYREEFNFPQEAVDKFHQKIDEIAEKIGKITCNGDIDVNASRAAADSVRDINNWLAVFKEEYDFPEEVWTQVHKKFDEIAEKIKLLECE